MSQTSILSGLAVMSEDVPSAVKSSITSEKRTGVGARAYVEVSGLCAHDRLFRSIIPLTDAM